MLGLIKTITLGTNILIYILILAEMSTNLYYNTKKHSFNVFKSNKSKNIKATAKEKWENVILILFALFHNTVTLLFLHISKYISTFHLHNFVYASVARSLPLLQSHQQYDHTTYAKLPK